MPAIHDTRCQTGAHSYDQDTGAIRGLALKCPGDFDVDGKAKKINRSVGAVPFLYRYQWFLLYFTDWDSVGPFLWASLEDTIEDYKNEKKQFDKDPHLALFWLLFFGVTGQVPIPGGERNRR